MGSYQRGPLGRPLEYEQYKKLAVITSQEMSEEAKADLQQIEAIKADLANGSRPGFGLMLLKTGSNVICVTVASKTGVHSRLLLKYADKIAVSLGGEPSISPLSLDDAFIEAQKGKCGAIYADAAGRNSLTLSSNV